MSALNQYALEFPGDNEQQIVVDALFEFMYRHRFVRDYPPFTGEVNFVRKQVLPWMTVCGANIHDFMRFALQACGHSIPGEAFNEVTTVLDVVVDRPFQNVPVKRVAYKALISGIPEIVKVLELRESGLHWSMMGKAGSDMRSHIAGFDDGFKYDRVVELVRRMGIL